MRTRLSITGIFLASCLSFALVAPWRVVADEEVKDTEKPASGKPEAARKSPATPKGNLIAIVGGDIHTITKEVIRGGTILVKDGKILRVGHDVKVPESASIVDAKGMHVTPGFVALSMSGVGLKGEGGGQRGGGGGGGPGGGRGGRLADSLDPYDRNMKFCLGVGITTGCVEIGGGGGGRFGRDGLDDTQVCPCCGLAVLPTEPITPPVPTPPTVRRNAILKMSFGDLDAMLVREGPFHHLPGSGLAGALNRFNWRENLKQAKKYLQEQTEHEGSVKEGNESRPPRRPVSDEFIRLAKKEIALRTDAASTTQIRDMIKLAKEFDYKLVLESAHEAWLLADEIAEARVDIILTPRSRRRAQLGRENQSGSSIETSALLEKAGVPFAIATQMSTVSLDGVYGGRDLTGFPIEAAFAVRGGCSEKTALAAITIVPARILGLDSRIGSIEEGKDADLLLHNGPPLDYRTYVQTAMIAGKVCYERNQDRVYPTFERPSR